MLVVVVVLVVLWCVILLTLANTLLASLDAKLGVLLGVEGAGAFEVEELEAVDVGSSRAVFRPRDCERLALVERASARDWCAAPLPFRERD